MCPQYNRAQGGQKTYGRICNVASYCVTPPVSSVHTTAMETMTTKAELSSDTELNDHLHHLYDNMLRGCNEAQREIDQYIYGGIILSDSGTKARLQACVPGQRLFELLKTPTAYSIHRDTLPDLGNFIRKVVLFSGDYPADTQIGNTSISSCIYEALPNIKRTKHVKNRIACVAPLAEGQTTNAIVTVILGTLLALYPGAAKTPSFKTRCRLV
jgi:hypothetical protein